MPRGLVIIGCGGQGREIAAIAMRVAEASGDGSSVLGFVDDDPSAENVERVEALGLRVLGASDVIESLPAGTGFLVGIADGTIRERLALAAEKQGLTPTTLQHPEATVGPACHLGAGTVLWAGGRLTTNVTLGRHVHVNQNVTIGHDTVADDYSTINPSAAVSGSVRLGRRCLVGAGSVILQGRTVGDDAVVGASACVARDVASSAMVKGVPAR
jgi:sugar O-acyltransferase (sialic acid O-acetyltransferase NeuD family)